jgi:hypothetical protein
MNRLSAGIAAIGLGLSSQAALAYEATADVTFSWANDGLARGWTSSAPNSFSAPPSNANLNTTYFTSLTGSNSTAYYNADFAKSTDATGWCGPGTEAFQAQYACKTGTNTPIPTAGAGNIGPGASATGTLTVTDTTMTGTLTVILTSDEGAGPQPGTTAATGYNIRSADGSPFKNVWYGVSSAATLTVNLTGTFTATDWDITGGTVTITDPSFQCGVADFSGVLCAASTVGGGFQADGSGLSWGIDQGTGGGTPVTPINVYSEVGGLQADLIATLSGVLASLSVAGNGAITTDQGEIRVGSGSNGSGCPQGLRYNGTGITCGTLQVSTLNITGTAQAATEAPDPFTFTAQTNAALSTVATSNTVTITGLTAAAAISVTGGEYSIGCTASFTSAAGTINNNDTVCVRQTSSATPGTTTNTVLTVGGGSGTFAVTTVPADTTPDAFSFVDQTDVALSTAITSAPVTIAGINAAAAISITGGQYSINGGAFTSAAGTVTSGQQVAVRVTSAATGLTATDATLTVGGVSDTFTATTLDVDTNPDGFSFTDQINVALSTVVTSNTVSITGINVATPISVTGGEYSVGCTGTFTSAAGSVNNNDTVCVRQTSSAAPATTTNTVLTVGGAADTFSLTTVPADTTPEAFSFTDQTGVAFNTVVTSNTVTITGINTGAAITVTGGEYSVNGGAFTAAAGSVTPGAQVRVRQTSAGTATTTTNTVLTIGGVSGTFAVTTADVPPDPQPDAFTFTDVDNADLDTLVESDEVEITGINVAAPITIATTSGPPGRNSEYRINGGAWTSAAGTINDGDLLQVRHLTSTEPGDAVVTVVTIGNASPAPSSQRRQAEFSSLTTPSLIGGSSSMDGLALGLLGVLALLRRRRTVRA